MFHNEEDQPRTKVKSLLHTGLNDGDFEALDDNLIRNEKIKHPHGHLGRHSTPHPAVNQQLRHANAILSPTSELEIENIDGTRHISVVEYTATPEDIAARISQQETRIREKSHAERTPPEREWIKKRENEPHQ